jgi:hypothetical protein
MAVQVFKDGRNEFIDPLHLQNHLDAGWSVDDPDAPLPQGITIINQKPEGEPHVVVPPITPSELIPQPKKRGRPKAKA